MGGFSQVLTSLADKLSPTAKTFAEDVAPNYMKSLESYWGGSEAGKVLLDLSKNKQLGERIYEGQGQDLINQASKKFDFDRLEKIIDGKIQPATPEEASMAAKLKQLGDSRTNFLNSAGVRTRNVTGRATKLAFSAPQAWTPTAKSDIVDHLVKSNQATTPVEANDIADKLLYGSRGRHGVGNFYQGQYNVPVGVADAADRWTFWNSATSKRMAEIEAFGPNDELLAKVLQVAKLQKGEQHAEALANTLDVYLHETSGSSSYRSARTMAIGGQKFTGPGLKSRSAYEGQASWERWAKNFSSYTLLPKVGILHLGQIVNAPIVTSTKAVAQAFSDVIKDKSSALDLVVKSGAMADHIYSGMLDSLEGRGGVIGKIFHTPGLPLERKWYSVITGVAGRYHVQDLADRLIKNSEDKTAAMGLEVFGIKPADVIANKGLMPEDLDKASIRAVQESLFAHDPLKTPVLWGATPTSRLATLYKSFAFREGKLIKDSFTRAFTAARNGRPDELVKYLGYMATVFPTVGYFVHALSNMASLKSPFDEDKGVAAQAIEAYASAGAWGIFFDMMHAAERNALLEFGVGPVFSTPPAVATEMYKALKGEPRELGRDVTRRVPLVGPALSHSLFPPVSEMTKVEKKAYYKDKNKGKKKGKQEESTFDQLFNHKHKTIP